MIMKLILQICQRCAAANWTYSAVNATAAPPLVLASFEAGTTTPFLSSAWTKVNATGCTGQCALLPVGDYLDAWTFSGLPTDWSAFDVLRFDVVNPLSSAQGFYMELRDAQSVDYWSRVNW